MRQLLGAFVIVALLVTACGGGAPADSGGGGGGGGGGAGGDLPAASTVAFGTAYDPTSFGVSGKGR